MNQRLNNETVSYAARVSLSVVAGLIDADHHRPVYLRLCEELRKVILWHEEQRERMRRQGVLHEEEEQ